MWAMEVEGLTKRYGARRGIEEISMRVPEGVIFGFIGPNGAGKSTLIRTVLGLLRPTAGRARIFGLDVVEEGPRSRAGVGYVPGETQFWGDLSVRDLLAWLGRFHPGDHGARRAALVERLEVDLKARAVDLSLGNRKKVAIIAALQHRPRLILLDEPTNGLDPVMQGRLFELLEEEARGGATVFFSSHVLSEVQRVCRTVAVISEGRLVAVEEVAALRARQLRRVRASFAAVPEALKVAALPGVAQLERTGDGLSFLYGGEVPPLLSALAADGPRDVRIEEPSLEEIFLRHYVKGGEHAGQA